MILVVLEFFFNNCMLSFLKTNETETEKADLTLNSLLFPFPKQCSYLVIYKLNFHYKCTYRPDFQYFYFEYIIRWQNGRLLCQGQDNFSL